MFPSVADDIVASGRKKQEAGMLIIRLIKEAWKILLSSAIQVTLNSFNDIYIGNYFSFEIVLHNFQREIQVKISPNWIFIIPSMVLFKCINMNEIPLGVVKARGL